MADLILGFVIGFGSGGALIWFCKTQIQSMVIGVNALSAKLHAEANALVADVTPVVAAAKTAVAPAAPVAPAVTTKSS